MIRFSLSASFDRKTVLIVPVFQGEKSPVWPSRAKFPTALLVHAQEDGFHGKAGEVLLLRSSGAAPADRFILAGLGKKEEAGLSQLRGAAAAALRKALETSAVRASFFVPDQMGGAALELQAMLEGVGLAAYRFDRHKSRPSPAPLLGEAVFCVPAVSADLRAALARAQAAVSAVNAARDLINEPPSKKTPDVLARFARSLAKDGVSVKVFGKPELEKMGAEALLGVNRGSAHPPVLLHMQYKPAGKAKRAVCFVGKGITFDSGGLSLKTMDGMMTMKYDMAGAASAMSLMTAVAALKPSVEVHVVAPVTENMPGPDAYKPGDVMKALNGKTIEVLNTDAEGRIVLADALSYASKLPVQEIVDIATLTGAASIALGPSIAAVMANDDEIMGRLQKAADVAGEKIWRLPLEKDYKDHIKSKVADLKNIGNPGQAGTIIGGLFLEEFVAGKKWAHIDMAAVGWSASGNVFSPAGATGALVRTLLNFLLGE